METSHAEGNVAKKGKGPLERGGKIKNLEVDVCRGGLPFEERDT